MCIFYETIIEQFCKFYIVHKNFAVNNVTFALIFLFVTVFCLRFNLAFIAAI